MLPVCLPTLSVSSSGNTAQALAYGNLANSSVNVAATNILTNQTGNNANLDLRAYEASIVYASFSANNVQAATGSIGATLLDGGTATEVLTTVGDDVSGSTVASKANTLSAGATANSATTGLSIDGNTIGSSGALASLQVLNFGNITATIGIDGDPNEGGVIASLTGSVDDSTVTVGDNAIAGLVTGNSAANNLVVSGNTVPSGPMQTVSTVYTEANVPQENTVASDYGLANSQLTDFTVLRSEVYGTFAIDMVDSETILNSTIAVDGNVQSARGVANTAVNDLSLSGTNLSAGSALSSNQYANSDVIVLSSADIFAPAVSTGSSISMADNRNTAVSVMNNVTNTLDVTATNTDPKTALNDALLNSTYPFAQGELTSSADHILHNQQTAADGLVNATAVTNIFNDDFAGNPSPGLVDGTLTIAGNSTSAEAAANRATNIVTVAGTSSLLASAGVNNMQFNNTEEVNALASTSAEVTLYGDTALNAVDASSITQGANTTSSLARGNAATNALNYYGWVPIMVTGLGPCQVTHGFSRRSTAATVSACPGWSAQHRRTIPGGVGIKHRTPAMWWRSTRLADSPVYRRHDRCDRQQCLLDGLWQHRQQSVTLAPLNTGMATAAIGNSQ